MSERFEWRDVTTEYRDVLTSARGDELRWIVNREEMRDTVTGRIITRRIVRAAGVCVIVPILPDGRILLVRQYRFPIRTELWELPAGTLTAREERGRAVPSESPDACAARELAEETGYEATRLTRIAEWYAMPGGHDVRVHLFTATGLVQRQQCLDEGEVIDEIRPFTAAQLEAMIARGEIRDAKTLAGLLHVLGRRPEGIRLRG